MNYSKFFKEAKKNELGCGVMIILFIVVVALAFGISCLYAWIGMLLWNWIMPIIWAEAPVMTFWPMWGLYELCSILFKAKVSSNNN